MTNKEKNDKKRLPKSDQELIEDFKKNEARQNWNKGKLTIWNVIWVMFLNLAITDGFNWFYLIMLIAMFPWWWMIISWSEKKIIELKYRKEIQAVRDKNKENRSNQ